MVPQAVTSGAAGVGVKGGDKVAKVLASIGHKLASGKHVNVGFLANATYQATVHKPKQGGLPVAQAAFWDEFGTAHSPPRPFFRQMIAEKSPEWAGQLAKALKVSGYDAQKALTLMGDRMKRQLQDSIRNGSFPPLSAITLMLRKMQDDDPNLVVSRKTLGEAARRVAKGESGAVGDRGRPLQDTLTMINAVDFEVKK